MTSEPGRTSDPTSSEALTALNRLEAILDGAASNQLVATIGDLPTRRWFRENLKIAMLNAGIAAETARPYILSTAATPTVRAFSELQLLLKVLESGRFQTAGCESVLIHPASVGRMLERAANLANTIGVAVRLLATTP